MQVNMHLDEATTQSYIDGELSAQEFLRAEEHLQHCTDCRAEIDAAQAEMNQFYTCFGEESQIVPTEILRTRIEHAISESSAQPRATALIARPGRSLPERLRALFSFGFATPAFAACAVVVAAFLGTLFYVVNERQENEVGRETASSGIERQAATQSPANSSPVSQTASANNAVLNGSSSAPRPRRNGEGNQIVRNQAANRRPSSPAPTQPRAANREEQFAFLPGERSYLETIAALTAVIETGHHARLDPSLQSEYERNLAVVDRAIAVTRLAARERPNETEPAQLLYVAYQSKIDLLSAVAYQARN
jgi:hypothetical protein